MICIQKRIKSESTSLMSARRGLLYLRFALIDNVAVARREIRDRINLDSRHRSRKYSARRADRLRDLTEPLSEAGFVIERICEPMPNEELKLQDPKGYDRLCRLPAFIFRAGAEGQHVGRFLAE
jgi:hypothetical protein